MVYCASIIEILAPINSCIVILKKKIHILQVHWKLNGWLTSAKVHFLHQSMYIYIFFPPEASPDIFKIESSVVVSRDKNAIKREFLFFNKFNSEMIKKALSVWHFNDVVSIVPDRKFKSHWFGNRRIHETSVSLYYYYRRRRFNFRPRC